MIAVVLISGIVVSGIADAALRCCDTMLDARIASFGRAAAADDSHCQAAPPPCCAGQAPQADCPSAPAADDDAGDTCCRSDLCDTLRSSEFLQNSSTAPPLAHDRQVRTTVAVGLAAGVLAPQILRTFPHTLPIYLLKNAILC